MSEKDMDAKGPDSGISSETAAFGGEGHDVKPVADGKGEDGFNRALSRFILVILLAVAIYGAFVARSGFAGIRDSLASFDGSMFLLALALASANYAIRVVRWGFYLRRLEVRIPAADVALSFLAGFAFTLTPGKVGEVFKSAVLLQNHGVPVERTAPIVLAERISDVIGVVALVFIGSLGFDGGLPVALAGAVCVALGMFLILKKGPLEWAVGLVAKGPERFRPLAPRCQSAVDALRLVSGKGAFLVPTLLSIPAWGLEGLSLFFILKGFGADCGMALSVFFYAVSTLGGALVVLVPGGLGVTEAMMQQMAVRMGGVAEGVATSGMLLTRFATLWWAVLLGFIALGLLKLRHPGFLALASKASRKKGPEGASGEAQDGK